MTNLTKLAFSTLAALVAATTIATAGPIIHIPMDPTPTIHPSAQVKDALSDAILGNTATPMHDDGLLIALACTVKGDDLRLSNVGDTLLPAGTRIKWKALDQTGVIKLTGPLAAGQSFRMADLLETAAEACSAKVA